MPDSFVILHDKILASDVSLVEWCPTMDLLALATTENNIWCCFSVIYFGYELILLRYMDL